MIILTSGKTYLDIDAYASMLAYRELLKSLGQTDVSAVSSAKLNSSVPPLIQTLNYHLDDITPAPDAKYIVLDVSNPDFLDPAVTPENLLEIIDHHTGFESYWPAQGVKTQIEFIGSVCTMIFEKIIENHKQEILDQDLSKLLLAGLLDNTLNLRASITTDRDREAYRQLMEHVPDTWPEEYFAACDAEKTKDYKKAILSDLKIENTNPSFPSVIGQLILQDPDKLSFETISAALSDHDRWLMNVISLRDGKSYLYFHDDDTRKSLEQLFSIPAENDHLLILPHFLLRKQILALFRKAPNRKQIWTEFK